MLQGIKKQDGSGSHASPEYGFRVPVLRNLARARSSGHSLAQLTGTLLVAV